jgi:hypothetical protein
VWLALMKQEEAQWLALLSQVLLSFKPGVNYLMA